MASMRVRRRLRPGMSTLIRTDVSHVDHRTVQGP
ncbi:MAG: hypothetical protein JWP42_3411, partial [Pseudomonas sp.]|nr:hypothetical protein [Pseudomonas sp.]